MSEGHTPGTLTALIHGDAGVGKSWLGNTAPAPRLILDAEGRAQYLPSHLPIVRWDPMNQSPPVADGTWETCVAVVPDFATMGRVYDWLQSGQHPFVSVVVDSLMEIQKRLKDQVAGLKQLDQQNWGEMLTRLEMLVRQYRDLVIVESNPTRCVVFTVGSKEGPNGKMKPMLQGAMAHQVPYFIDIVGYLYVTHNAQDPANPHRAMLTVPGHPTAVAKDGTDRLPRPAVDNPDLGEIFATLNGNAEATEAAAAPNVVPQVEFDPTATT